MLRPGLVSVTFRSSTPREVIELCARNNLQGIEWGGDVHVPHGSTATAAQVGAMTREHGISVVSYASYYRCDADELASFERVLACSLELGAPTIRVWAGQMGSAGAQHEHRDAVAEDLLRIAEIAAEHGISIATEYHQDTLTDTRSSCSALHTAAAHSNLKTLWQPLRRALEDPLTVENLEDLRQVLPRLAHVHVHEWAVSATGHLALPLESGQQWKQYLPVLKARQREIWMLLEFIPEESPDCLAREAATLLSWLESDV